MAKIFKRSITAIIICAAALSCGACAPAVIRQTASPALPPVDPSAVVTTERKSVRLYFRVADEDFIGSELRRVDVKASESIEEAAVRELIAGPKAEMTKLSPLINERTKVVSINKEGGILFLTLSSDFLNSAILLPASWKEDVSLREAAAIEKRLAISSIVNTLTELGTCDKVLITVEEGSGNATTPSEILTLFSSGDPLTYSGEFVLTPKRALEAVLHSIQQKDWARVMRLCDGTGSLSEAEIVSALLANGTLTDYIVDSDSSADAATAVVTASISLKGEDFLVRTRDGIPVRVTRVQEVFRIDYDSLLHLFGAEEGA